jgi:thiol-disulfide isomerase/thioredoxin
MLGFRFVILLLLAAWPLAAQICEAPPDVKAAIAAATLPASKPLEERADAARKVRDRFPSDYYAHRFYQEQYIFSATFAKSMREEYKTLLYSHPDDLMYQMLYARTLKGIDTRQAIALLDKILQKDPNYTLAHQKFTEIYSAPAFLDLPKLRLHLEAYWQGCPSSLVGYNFLTRYDDVNFLKTAAARLRHLLEGRTDNEALGFYSQLWAVEFKTVPLAGQEPVRDRIRADAARLRALDLQGRPFLLNELREAYQVLGDKEGSKWLADQEPKRGSATGNAVWEAINQWRRYHPYKPGEWDTYQDALLQQTAEWIKQWPDAPEARFERFNALRGWQDAPLEETVQAAEEWIRVYAAHKAAISPYMTVASFYAQHNMRYSELPDLLDKALAAMPPPPQPTPPPVSDLYLPANRPSGQSILGSFSEPNQLAGIYIKIRNFDKAHELLAKTGPPLLEAVKNATETERRQFTYVETNYWNNMSRLARLEGRKLDALEADRNAYFASPSNNEYMKNSLRDQWKVLKGTEEGFDAWATKPADTEPHVAATPSTPPAGAVSTAGTPAGWSKLDKPLPDFEMSDAAGKTWRLADLKGKVTLINLWATWCGPCQAELPYLQKLFDKVRERKDLIVLTLNTDTDVGLILPFLHEKAYTFPVLAADTYAHKLVPELSIPRNWIVDADGVLRIESVGFGGGDDKWVTDMLAIMEKARLP